MTNEQLDGNTEKKYKIITSGGPINIDMPHGWSIQLVPSEVQRDSDPYSQYQLHEAIEKIKALEAENVALRKARDEWIYKSNPARIEETEAKTSQTKREKVFEVWSCIVGKKSPLNTFGKVMFFPMTVTIATALSIMEILFTKNETE